MGAFLLALWPDTMLAQTVTITPADSNAITITSGTGPTVAATMSATNDTALPVALSVANTASVPQVNVSVTLLSSPPGQGGYVASVPGYSILGLGLQGSPTQAQAAYINGPTVTINDTGYVGAYTPSLAGSVGVITAASTGANGAAATTPSPGAGAYNAGAGGAVNFTLGQVGTVSTTFNSGTPQGTGIPWQPNLSNLLLTSTGGAGTNPYNSTLGPGGGGNGGAISVTQANDSGLVLQSLSTNSGSINGITALSQGGSSGIYYDSGMGVAAYGPQGNGGSVTVTEGGYISVSPGSTGNSIGIVAASIGGAPQPEANWMTFNERDYRPIPGAGGPVSVSLTTGASVNLAGNTAIGVMAASFAGTAAYSGLAASGGPVGVTVGPGASIATGSPSSDVSIGILAISGGSATLLEPFATNAVGIGNSGYGGPVTVSNAGSITTAGELSAGIAALSVGGAGIVTRAITSSVSILGSVSPNSETAQGSSVAVANTGSISADGASAFGIVALSGGAGGLLAADGNAVFDGAATYGVGSGVIVGGSGNAGAGSPGGAVSVTNSGTISTGDANGGGNMAIGIVAQSIGGGGGSAGGHGAAAFVGDAGGAGGDGGPVTVSTAGGQISTLNDGAIGILAQSIGGGGGNGGNADGLFVAVGGRGGSGGAGGPVQVTLGSSGGSVLQSSGDFAAGVLAQSIGGGGGNGGYAKAAGLFISNAIGGAGGSGGAGGAVAVTNVSGDIITGGEQSAGILAQSVGGGGGNGGAAISRTVGVIFSSAIAVGGTGGSGGDGGATTVGNAGSISSAGPDSIGVIAQSIGGGGGTGGSALAKSLAIAGDPSIPTISFSTDVGGAGGGNGAGAAVGVTNAQGSIATQGNGAAAVLAQSIGGGGGNGGDSTAASQAILGKAPTFKISASIGGGGNGGGNGGDVSVTNAPLPSGASLVNGACTNCAGTPQSLITTAGNNAAGVIAQSIGGGGGNGGGGNATVGSPNFGGTPGISLSLSTDIGGTGGGAGDGGTVSVTNQAAGFAGNTYGMIGTTGSGAQGILAQSIGGGGGNGGGGTAAGSGDVVNLNVSVGGSGRGGGSGGGVTVVNAGTIATGQTTVSGGQSFTTGGDADGILAQSIGGGGGVGGSSDASAAIPTIVQIENAINAPAASYSANIGVGGRGGGGGDGGSVSATNAGGAITTLGVRAYGILAQSIGGGGGVGGAANAQAGAVILGAGPTYAATLSVGGSGGASGSGGTVTVANTGSIATAGYGATALLAQSIGGGGGVGAEGTVNNQTTIGLGLTVSGAGGTGGGGGTVTVADGGSAGRSIVTAGDDAYGILAQSIGGGGGAASAGCTNSASAGANGLSASHCLGNNTVGAAASVTPWTDSSDFSVGIGGGSGASGNGGSVSVTENGSIATAGARSIGIVAQSIGGGGGVMTASALNLASAVVQASPGQNTATGGAVAVTLGASGSITTTGAGAWGILAQSVGGGGGLVGDPSLALVFPVSNTLPTINAGGHSDGGSVTVTSAGDIITAGANAHGIVAQSIGGGGGIAAGYARSAGANVVMGNSAQLYGLTGMSYSGQGGAITVNQTGGTIRASGPGSIGIVAQSSGNANYQSQINVTIGGTVTGGTGTNAAGILLSGGDSQTNGHGNVPNLITVNAGGSVATMNGVNGTAITTDYGLTNVVNGGTIVGSILLGATPGTIDNLASGTISSGPAIVVSNDTFTNQGTLIVAGSGVIGTTRVTGSFAQTATGRLLVDVNSLAAQAADLLAVSGNATVGGTVVPTATALLPGAVPIMTAGSLSATATTQDPLLFHWNPTSTGTVLSLAPSSNFTPQGMALSGNQVRVALYLGRAWDNADRLLASSFGYLSQVSGADTYRTFLDALSPVSLATPVVAMAKDADIVLGSAMRCPVFLGASTLLGEDSCAWARFAGQVDYQYSGDGGAAYQASSTAYRLGAQKEVGPGWFLGGSLGTAQNWLRAGNTTTSGQTYETSMAVKHTAGPWLFAGSFALQSGAFQNSRTVILPAAGTVPGASGVLTSDSSALIAGGRLRAAYELPYETTYIRFYGDLDVVYNHMPAFQESVSSQGLLPFAVGSSSRTAVIISPMMQFGGRWDYDDATTLRPFIEMGIGIQPTNTQVVYASLVGANPADGAINAKISSPAVFGKANLGVQLYRAGRFDLRAEYGVQVAGNYFSQRGMLSAAYHF